MGKYLLLHAGAKPSLEGVLIEGTLMATSSVDEAVSIVEDCPDLSAVLIDTPSAIPDVDRLIKRIGLMQNDLLAFPILLLTDAAHAAEDEKFLGGVVIDLMERPLRQATFSNRLKNAENLVCSVTFSEFASMLRSLPANIYLKDNHGRYVFSSQTWEHLDTNNDPNWTIRGKTDLEIRKDKENAKKALESDLKILQTGKGTSYIIEENANGQEFLQLIKEPLFYEDGRVRGIIALINIVTEQERMRRELRERSIRDQMTGLFNRSYYGEYLQELEGHEPDPLSILVADCDHLKKVNDTYGHMAGNDYIKSCAKLHLEILPGDSTVFRTGGDEFVSFLPGQGEAQMEDLLKKMREGAKKYCVKGETLSVSFGYYTMHAGEKLTDCIEKADNRMYLDKAKNKNGKGR